MSGKGAGGAGGAGGKRRRDKDSDDEDEQENFDLDEAEDIPSAQPRKKKSKVEGSDDEDGAASKAAQDDSDTEDEDGKKIKRAQRVADGFLKVQRQMNEEVVDVGLSKPKRRGSAGGGAGGDDYEERDDEEGDDDAADARAESMALRDEEIARRAAEENRGKPHPGTIARVLIKNIRCHAHLELDLNPKVNFIIGTNGSGKSSILLAIRLALGMKVDKSLLAATGAAASAAGAAAVKKGKGVANKIGASGVRDTVTIGSIVRTGSDGEAVAEIDMRNYGDGCLRQSQWGYMFTLRRTLKINKNNGKCTDTLDAFKHVYTDAKGKEIAGNPFTTPGVDLKRFKLEPVKRLTSEGLEMSQSQSARATWIQEQLELSFNAYYSNPLMIMDQETSKSFFTGSGKAKYKFFLEATGLQRNFDIMQEVVGVLSGCKKDLEIIGSRVDGLREDHLRYKRAEDSVKGLSVLDDQIKALEADVEFARLEEEERSLAAKKADDKNKAQLDNILANLPKLNAVIAQQQANIDAATKALADLEADREAMEDKVHRKMKEHAEAEKPAMQAKAALAAPAKAIAKAEKELKFAVQDLKEFEADLAARNTASLRAAYKRKLDGLLKKEADALKEKTTAEGETKHVDQAYTDAQRALNEAKNNVESARQELARANEARAGYQDQIRELERDAAEEIREIKARHDAKAKGLAYAAVAAQRIDDGMNHWQANHSKSQQARVQARSKLQQAVAAGRFKHPPLNPLGSYIRMDTRYAKAVDSVSMMTLLDMIVDNAEDAKVFQELVGMKYSRVQGYKYEAPKTVPEAPAGGAGAAGGAGGAGARSPPLNNVSNHSGMLPRITMAEINAKSAEDGNSDLVGHRLVDLMTVDNDWAWNAVIEKLSPHKIIVGKDERELRTLLRHSDGSSRRGIAFGLTVAGERLMIDDSGIVFRPREYDFAPFTLSRPLLPPAPAKSSSSSAAGASKEPAKEKTQQEEINEVQKTLAEEKAAMAADMAEAEDAVKRCQVAVRQAEQAQKAKQEEFNTASRQSGTVRGKLEAASKALNAARQALHKLQEEGEPEEDNEEEDLRTRSQNEARVASAKADLEEAQAAHQAATALFEELQAKADALLVEAQQLEKAAKSDERRLKAEEDLKVGHAGLKKFQTLLDQANERIVVVKEQMAKQNEAFTQQEAELLNRRTELQGRTGMTTVSERNKDKSPSHIKAEKDAIQKKLDADSKRYGKSPSEAQFIINRSRVAEVTYKARQEEYDGLLSTYQSLMRQKSVLIDRFHEDKRLLGKKIASDFKRRMGMAGSMGKLDFTHSRRKKAGDKDKREKEKEKGPEKHDEGDLRVMVAPDFNQRADLSQVEASQGAGAGMFSQHANAHAFFGGAGGAGGGPAYQDAATLSGGEKSVSTLNLISSIAHFCYLPLRAIDEFDVFQDEKNRKESLKTLLAQGQKQNEAGFVPQLILLTPHDISSVVDLSDKAIASTVGVFALKEAKRSSSDDAEGGGAGGAGGRAGRGARAAARSSSSSSSGAGASDDDDE